MSRRQGSEVRAMQAAALVRLPPDLFASVAAAAAAEHLSIAAWLRALAVAALGASGEARRPSRPRRSLPPADVVAVAELREAVGLAVGALVRSAAFAREQGDIDTHAESETLIRTFRKHAFELDALKAMLLGSPGVKP